MKVPVGDTAPPSGFVMAMVCAPSPALAVLTFTLNDNSVPPTLAVVVLELVTNVMPEPLKTTVAPLCKPVPVIVTACAEAPCARGKPL